MSRILKMYPVYTGFVKKLNKKNSGIICTSKQCTASAIPISEIIQTIAIVCAVVSRDCTIGNKTLLK